jgi:ubiquitin-protein ligase
MSEVRTRRLLSDYEAIRRLVRGQQNRILVAGVAGNPPDRYQIVYRVRSLRESGAEIVLADEHYVEIVLPSAYPRDAPFFRMLTPVFHPNIAPHAVCIGDHWTAGQSLAELVQRVGEMLAFQSYNTKSPLNGRAAQWVEENLARLPIDPAPFALEDALGRA